VVTAQLVVRWPVLDDSLRLRDLEPLARAEWPAFVAEQGVWGTTEPVFTVREADPTDVWDEDEDTVLAVLVGTADVLAGPIALRSLAVAR
jgi:hypothetical protein